jgi:uncharacterized Zn finger protein
MATRLADVITRAGLRQMAGGTIYQRGRWYASDGAVSELEETGGRVSARVRGTRSYEVVLDAVRGQLGFNCSCPMGLSGLFCKHCVAVGLAWLESVWASPRDEPQPVAEPEDVRAFVLYLSKEALAEIVLTHAAEDKAFGHQLEVLAAASRPGGPDIKLLHKALAAATKHDGLAWWQWDSVLVARTQRALEPVRLLAKGADARVALDLAEYVLLRLAEVVAHHRSGIEPVEKLAEDVRQLHLEAWHAAKPDAKPTAGRLFVLMTTVPPAVPPGALLQYTKVLGIDGLVEFRRLAHEAWDRIPVVGPDQVTGPDAWVEQERYGAVLHAIARLTGNNEEEALALQRNLSGTERFEDIARLYAAAGQHQKAIEWAERGQRSFPEIRTRHLRDLLVEEYARVGRKNDVLNMVWADFSDRPTLWNYERLRAYARQFGQWPTWRAEAIELLRLYAARSGADAPGSAVTLVDALLNEGDDETAWRLAVGLSLEPTAWLRLGRARAKAHPQDAGLAYQRFAELLLAKGGQRNQKAAISWLLKAARLFNRAGLGRDFQQHLEGLRELHKRKRYFARLLDETTWPWQQTQTRGRRHRPA